MCVHKEEDPPPLLNGGRRTRISWGRTGAALEVWGEESKLDGCCVE